MISVKCRRTSKVLDYYEVKDDEKEEEVQHPVQKFIISAEMSLEPSPRYTERKASRDKNAAN